MFDKDKYGHLQGGQDKEHCEVDLDDNRLVVGGKGVGEVGDDDQDGGGQEGGRGEDLQLSQERQAAGGAKGAAAGRTGTENCPEVR